MQTFRAITNGDLSPLHIISSGGGHRSAADVPVHHNQAANTPTGQNPTTKSPIFDKGQITPTATGISMLTNGFLSSGNSSMSSPESPYRAITSPICITPMNYCPYSGSPFLEKYEEAENSVCFYSQELRARLLKHHSANSNTNTVPDFIPLEDGDKKWKLGITSLEGGKKLKTLLANSRLHPNEAVVELVGKFQLSSSFQHTRLVVLLILRLIVTMLSSSQHNNNDNS